MANINDGGPAFPTNSRRHEPEPGMTLRDYFAAHALQGLIAGDLAGFSLEDITNKAWRVADLMIEHRSNK